MTMGFRVGDPAQLQGVKPGDDIEFELRGEPNKDDEYVITASTPGLKAEDLSVEVLGDTVTVSGEIFAPAPDEKAKYVLQERRYGKFARTLTLPVELDSAKAEAVIENGLLTLRVPKAEAARPKMIKVKAK